MVDREEEVENLDEPLNVTLTLDHSLDRGTGIKFGWIVTSMWGGT